MAVDKAISRFEYVGKTALCQSRRRMKADGRQSRNQQNKMQLLCFQRDAHHSLNRERIIQSFVF